MWHIAAGPGAFIDSEDGLAPFLEKCDPVINEESDEEE